LCVARRAGARGRRRRRRRGDRSDPRRARRGAGLNLKRPREIDAMAEAGVVNREALSMVAQAIEPGVTTAELNDIAERAIVSAGGTPAFLGYRGFPATLCTSVNEVVVHGFPDDRPLRDG